MNFRVRGDEPSAAVETEVALKLPTSVDELMRREEIEKGLEAIAHKGGVMDDGVVVWGFAMIALLVWAMRLAAVGWAMGGSFFYISFSGHCMSRHRVVTCSHMSRRIVVTCSHSK